MWQLVFALRHRLIPQQQEEHAKRVSDGHGLSFGSGPWQKEKKKKKKKEKIIYSTLCNVNLQVLEELFR